MVCELSKGGIESRVTPDSDKVLSAIRRGVESLPGLKSETGIDYAQLHLILHQLEFEWRSIQRRETLHGDRYSAKASEKIGPADSYVAMAVTPPMSQARTKASQTASEAAFEQERAPLCIKCHGVCWIHGFDRDGRRRWKCIACGLTFIGTRSMNVIKKEKRDQAVELLKQAQAGMCDCGCSASHKGRCSARRQAEPENDGHANDATRKAMKDGVLVPGLSPEAACAFDIPASPVGDELVFKLDPSKAPMTFAFIRPAKPEPSLMEPLAPVEWVPNDFCRSNCNPGSIGHHMDCGYWKARDGSKLLQILNSRTAEQRMFDSHFLNKLSLPPSAILKQLVNDDSYFMNAYETLIGILDSDMDQKEKDAVWVLICYLKDTEKIHLEAGILDSSGVE